MFDYLTGTPQKPLKERIDVELMNAAEIYAKLALVTDSAEIIESKTDFLFSIII